MITYSSFGEPQKIVDDVFLSKLKSELSSKFNKKLKKRLQVLKSNSTKYKKAKKLLKEEIKTLTDNVNKNQYFINSLLEDIRKEVLAYEETLSKEGVVNEH